jgi:hypothetical protein
MVLNTFKKEWNMCHACGRIKIHREFWWGTGMKAMAWKIKVYREKNYIKVDLKGNTMETVDRLIWLRSDTSGRLY